MKTKFNKTIGKSVVSTLALSLMLATVSPISLSQAQQAEQGYKQEITALRMNPKINKAFAAIEAMEPTTEAVLIELTEIPAPPFKEDKRGARYAELLKAAGADEVKTDEVGNIIALRRGTGSGNRRVVAINAHLDTVFPEGTDVTVRREGEKLFAPGIGDDTRGLVVVLTVLKAMEAAGIETEADILFIGGVGEEGLGDLRGVKHLFREGAQKIDSFIAVDGGTDNRLTFSGIGSNRYRVTFKGSGGHSWGNFGYANPHHALGRAISYFDDMALPVTATGPKSSYNIGRIGGGTSINSIPFTSWMEVDMRSGDPKRVAAVDAVFQTAMQKALREENEARTSGDEITMDIDKVGVRPAGIGDPKSPLVQRTMATIEIFGLTPDLRSGSTDSNIPISLGIPAVTLSKGGIGGGAHSPAEWWQNKNGKRAIEIALLTLVAEAGVAK